MVNTIARRILLCLAAIAGLMAGTVSLVAVAANPTAVSSGSEAVISGIFRNSARTGRAVVPDSPLPSGFRVPSGMEEYTSPAYAAVQDTSRFLWIGTDSGLLKYDGYDVYSYTFIPGDSRSLCNNHVSALLYFPDYGKMVVGTDVGVSVYDFGADSFASLQACGYRQVKTLLSDGDRLWIGTVEGLMCFDISQGISPEMKPDELPRGAGRSPFSDHIACARKIGDYVYFGAYDCFYRYSPADGFVRYGLGTDRKLVLDIAESPDDPSLLWLGTEQGIVVYDMEVPSVAGTALDNIPVKYFFRYSGSQTWIGTDNGLFIKEGSGFVRFSHEAGSSASLPNNVVWSIFRSMTGEVFICTDYGVALPSVTPGVTFCPLASFTGSREGQDIMVMETDPAGNLWMGGMGGLVMKSADGRYARWYRSDTGKPGMRLSHNKVRDLSDDGTGLLIVSDGGLDRLDYATGLVRHYDITDPSGTYLSTWMYSVATDSLGRLWLGTYDGLLMIEDMESLLSSYGTPYPADRQYDLESDPPIAGNAVMDIAVTGNFAAVLSNGMVDMIDLTSGDVTYVGLPSGLYASTLVAGKDCIWAGTSGGLFRLSEDGRAVQAAGFRLSAGTVAPAGDRLLVVSDRDVYVYDSSEDAWMYSMFSDNPVLCGLAAEDGTVFLGSKDGYYRLNMESLPCVERRGRVSVTGLFLDNALVRVGREYDGNVILGKNMALTSGIDLKSDQNSFTIVYSDFSFSDVRKRFMYRLTGFDDTWQLTSDNRAVFLNVPGGRYVFEVAVAPADGIHPGVVTSFPVRVRTVWYATPFAYIVYFLLITGMCIAVIYYIRMKHQLQMEHAERDRALKMADMKTEFLANVSHEFKSPLSIILGFVGRMIASESDSLRTRELNTVRQNAEKIHLLLDQMVQFNENGGTSLFIPAATSIQELVKSVYDRYADAFAQKEISSRFVSDDIGYIFMVDRLKMESVIQNLLSNALNFTPSGGSVLVSVTVGEETPEMLYADIRVEDTGCGIAPEEQSLIFNRYYRTASSRKNSPGGSGIGLALVKEIVEQHKGRITVSSEPGKGTAFTVRLSTMKADSFVLKSAGREEYSLHSLSNVWQHQRKPVILLVEDNYDIRDFITASLGKDYVFLVADEGQAGLDLLAREKIDLVITDIAMPEGMDGLTMSRAIRNSLKTAFLPIIVLTGRNDEQTEMKSFEYADAFISKPFSLNYLNNRIIQLLIKHEHYLARMRQQQMLEPGAVEEEKSFDEKLLQEVVDIVSRHLEDPDFSASVLCGESRYSSKQIYRKIKQLTGMSIVEFIRDTRLRKAALYLSQGKLSVTEVMYKVGFTTASWFAKCFKDKFGVSPSDYVRKE